YGRTSPVAEVRAQAAVEEAALGVQKCVELGKCSSMRANRAVPKTAAVTPGDPGRVARYEDSSQASASILLTTHNPFRRVSGLNRRRESRRPAGPELRQSSRWGHREADFFQTSASRRSKKAATRVRLPSASRCLRSRGEALRCSDSRPGADA